MIKRDELTPEAAVKERYERPRLVRHGPLRDVTGQSSPPGGPPEDQSADDTAADDFPDTAGGQDRG